jgi:hypothetical protein
MQLRRPAAKAAAMQALLVKKHAESKRKSLIKRLTLRRRSRSHALSQAGMCV